VDKLELVLKASKDLSQYLERLIPIIDKAASNFVSGDEASANKYYAECVDAISLFADVIEGMETLLITIIPEASIADDIKKLAETFVSMEQAQERKDWIALSDTMRNELSPEIEGWLIILSKMEEEIKKRVSP